MEASGHSEIVARNSSEYIARMNRVTGTYRNGSVVLDQPVDWPDGMPVNVMSEVIMPSAGEREGMDQCFDGSLCEDTPEAMQRWLEWFDSLKPVLRGQELERFDAGLRAAHGQMFAPTPRKT